MEYLDSNITYDDCVIVALFNAAKAAGKNVTYDSIYVLALKSGWYKPGSGFMCDNLDAAFDALKLKARLLSNPCTRKIFRNIREDKKIYMFFKPSDWSELPGHAMVAAKGEHGVKVYNSYYEGTGWKTLSKLLRQGEKHYAIEITRSA